MEEINVPRMIDGFANWKFKPLNNILCTTYTAYATYIIINDQIN